MGQFEPFLRRYFRILTLPWVGGWVGEKRPQDFRTKWTQKSLILKRIRLFWSCWPDSNWRPHPYQPLWSMKTIVFRCFRAVFFRKKFLLRSSLQHCFQSQFTLRGSSCGSGFCKCSCKQQGAQQATTRSRCGL